MNPGTSVSIVYSASHRRRVKTEEKAKVVDSVFGEECVQFVVASIWGEKCIQFFAALAILPMTILKNRMN